MIRHKIHFHPTSCANAAKCNLLTLLVIALFTWFATQPPVPRPLLQCAKTAPSQQRAQGNTNPIAEDFPSQPVQEDLSEHQRGTRPRASSPSRPRGLEPLLVELWGVRSSVPLRAYELESGLLDQSGPPLFLLHLQILA